MNIEEQARKYFKPGQVQDAGKNPPKISTNEKERQQLRELSGIIAENIKKSSIMRAKINKGITAGTSDRELLLMALECIADMTGDRVFKLNIDKVKER